MSCDVQERHTDILSYPLRSHAVGDGLHRIQGGVGTPYKHLHLAANTDIDKLWTM